MSNEVLIKVEGVRKKFCRSLKKSLWYGVKDMGAEMLGGSHQHDQLRPDEFWAVKDVSFEVRRGECLGLIGRNGAGKTTLLKMLNGLIKPDQGRIEMRGRVGALIALGAGFNPILTGRENIYVNGSVLGLTKKEIDEKIDDIINFAEIREFIDAPVQSYSSGMQVRLGFAVATAMEPDILLLDEVLAVGDVAFRTKCFVRISSLMGKAAVIFVSHTEEQLIRICSSGLLLKQGQVTYAGALKDCLNVYRESQPQNEIPRVNYQAEGVKEGAIKLSTLEHLSGGDLAFELHYAVDRNIDLGLHVLAMLDENEMDAAACDLLPLVSQIPAGTKTWKCVIKALSLRPGIYHFALEALSTQHGSIVVRKRFPEIRLRVKESIAHWSNYTPKVSLVEG
jgi:ABC-type polysaccharide/polyol phosphate transport system ATPase subunit